MERYQRNHILSSYYAPRGHIRMQELGMRIAQQYLSPTDKLIGIIGDAGSGKSALIRGMFPGLELTNDDNGIYIRPLPILSVGEEHAFYSPHTYHLDIRFETGFSQLTELADAIKEALKLGRRVVVEHFELIYPILGANANMLIGVGEQVLISRPSLFGPAPDEIRDVVYQSLRYRHMAHTAEDLCEMCMSTEDLERCGHDDVKHGFCIYFYDKKPDFSITELEAKVKDMIAQCLPVGYVDENHVNIGGKIHPCTGPRVHVANTSQIEGFNLLRNFIYDPYRRRHVLVGCVGEHSIDLLRSLMDKHQRPGWE